jgi:hypothetical protein
MKNEEWPGQANAKLRMQKSRVKPRNATAKPPQSHLIARGLRPQSHPQGTLTRIFHKGIEQRSGEGVRRLDITEPNESTTRRFFYDRL